MLKLTPRLVTINYCLKIDKISNNFDHSVVFQKLHCLSPRFHVGYRTPPFCRPLFNNQPHCEPVKLMKFRSQPSAISVRGFSGLEELYQWCHTGGEGVWYRIRFRGHFVTVNVSSTPCYHLVPGRPITQPKSASTNNFTTNLRPSLSHTHTHTHLHTHTTHICSIHRTRNSRLVSTKVSPLPLSLNIRRW